MTMNIATIIIMIMMIVMIIDNKDKMINTVWIMIKNKIQS